MHRTHAAYWYYLHGLYLPTYLPIVMLGLKMLKVAFQHSILSSQALDLVASKIRYFATIASVRTWTYVANPLFHKGLC